MSSITAKIAVPELTRGARVLERSWKVTGALGVVALVSTVLYLAFPKSESTTLGISERTDALQVPPLVLDVGTATLIGAILLIAIAAWSAYRTALYKRTPLGVLVAFGLISLMAFLIWVASGQTLPVPGLLAGTIGLSIPLIFGAVGGVIAERVGVVNVAIEGQLLAGAFTSAVIASITKQPLIGLVAAGIAGALVAAILAVFAIKYFVEQVIVGVVLNVFVIGLTGFLYTKILAPDSAALNAPPRFQTIPIPLLGDIPLLGPVLFKQTIIVYVLYLIVPATYFALFRSKWGLRVRAIGEHPEAADSVGINVRRTRFITVAIAGAVAGLGGAFFTLGSVGAFNKEMTAGAGYIALAAVIIGRWNPVRAMLAGLLFGFAKNLQNVLAILGSPVPSEFMLMLPYVVTLLAVAGFVGRVSPPAAAGKPYRGA
ncbi:UNVERIFIED_ORG: ABC-type uncharacterized transport system permease subunit [Arthrobacter sp. UYCu721]